MDPKHDWDNPLEVLEEAVKREQDACTFYAALRDHSKLQLIRELTEHLCEEAHRHIQLIEKQIIKLRLG